MGFRVNKRVGLGGGKSVNLGKSGASVSKRTSAGSIGLGKSGPRGSVRVAKGISWTWGKR